MEFHNLGHDEKLFGAKMVVIVYNMDSYHGALRG